MCPRTFYFLTSTDPNQYVNRNKVIHTSILIWGAWVEIETAHDILCQAGQTPSEDLRYEKVCDMGVYVYSLFDDTHDWLSAASVLNSVCHCVTFYCYLCIFLNSGTVCRAGADTHSFVRVLCCRAYCVGAPLPK